MELWNEKQNHRENAERFSIYIFLHQKWKQCLEFALAKLIRSANIWLMLTIQTVMSAGYTVLILSAKTRQENQRNEASRL